MSVPNYQSNPGNPYLDNQYVEDFPFAGIGKRASAVTITGQINQVPADGSATKTVAITYPFQVFSGVTLTCEDLSVAGEWNLDAQPVSSLTNVAQLGVIVNGGPPGSTVTVNYSFSGQ